VTASRQHPFVIAALFAAALACYANAPRLHVVQSIGDTLNAVRVLDPMSHILLAAHAAQDTEEAQSAREDLNDGRQSVAVIGSTPMLIAAASPTLTYTQPTLAPDDPQHGPDGYHASIAALPGAWRTLDLPPPRSCCDPVDLKTPLSRRLRAPASRGPPLL
jgi:hypothetical protein